MAQGEQRVLSPPKEEFHTCSVPVQLRELGRCCWHFSWQQSPGAGLDSQLHLGPPEQNLPFIWGVKYSGTTARGVCVTPSCSLFPGSCSDFSIFLFLVAFQAESFPLRLSYVQIFPIFPFLVTFQAESPPFWLGYVQIFPIFPISGGISG